MFLSQLVLNARARKVQRDLASPYEMHRTLLHAFGDGLARTGEGAERILYRVEAGRGSGFVVLVQSQTKPNWRVLDAEYLAAEAACKPFAPLLVQGQRLAFRLRANPTMRKKVEQKQSRRVGIYNEEAQLLWLARKLEEGGFGLLHATRSREELARGTIARPDGKHELHLLGVQFDGLLVVRDVHAATATLAQGVGSGKAFGFGLLSLAQAAS